MKPTSIRFSILKSLAIIFVLAAAAVAPAQSADVTMPINFQNVPVTTAIETLARLTGINFVFSESVIELNGPLAHEPTITTNWTGLTARQALERVLKEHGLYLVEDPVTTIAEISATNRIVNPLDASLLDIKTNGVDLPLRFINVPLDMALNTLIEVGHLDVKLDPKLTDHVDSVTQKMVRLPVISVSWESVTARQAIIALCENYNLTIVKDPATGGVQIKTKD